MTAITADLDPYLLPLPTADSPVVLQHLVAPMHAHLNVLYAAPVWPLAPLTTNPSANKTAVHWHRCPAVFQDDLRQVTWALINGELRPAFLKEHNTRMRARVAIDGIKDAVLTWMHLARWLEKREIGTLAACSTEVLHDYGLHLRDTASSRDRAQDILTSLTRLWAYDQLSVQPIGIGRPPWDQLGADDYLPAATSTSGGENEAEPLAEQTMGPLLVWAMRMVDDFADDILGAWAETRRLRDIARTTPATPAGRAALHAYLDPLIAHGGPSARLCRQGRQSGLRPALRRWHHGSVEVPDPDVNPAQRADHCGRRAARSEPAGHPGDRPDRRSSVAGCARLQRGRRSDAASGDSRLHRLLVSDRYASRRGPWHADRVLSRP